MFRHQAASGADYYEWLDSDYHNRGQEPLDPIIEDCETEDPTAWEAAHCNFCGYELDHSSLFRRNAWFHESCLQHIANMGGIDEC